MGSSVSFKIDFHVHTYHSYDSINSPADIIKQAKKRGIDAVVVVDHETIKGGQEASQLDSGDVLIIPSVEINTNLGDIVGLWVHEEIEAREYHEVIKAIKAQGGMTTLPHPFHKHKLPFPDDLFEMIDLIEINNSRAMPCRNRRAAKLAEKYNKPTCSGSDGHFPWEIGKAYAEFEETPSSIDQLKEILKKGKRTNHIKYSNPVGILIGQALKYWRRPDFFLKRLEKFGKK